MKPYLLAPVCFIAAFSGCLFFLNISDVIIFAGSAATPEILTAYLHTVTIQNGIDFHLLPSLLFAFFCVQAYLFFRGSRLWLNILLNNIFAFLVLFALIPLFFAIGYAGTEQTAAVPDFQKSIQNRIYRDGNRQYVYIDRNAVTATPDSVPVLSVEREFSYQSGAENRTSGREVRLIDRLLKYKVAESSVTRFFYTRFNRGRYAYLFSVAAVALLLASLWPFLKLSSWKALNVFAFAAAVGVFAFAARYVVTAGLVAGLEKVAAFLPADIVPLLCAFFCALLLNAAGIVGHIIHTSDKGAAHD